MARSRSTYVAYEGEDPVCVGSSEDIARFWGIAKDTVWYYASGSWHERMCEFENPRSVYRVDEEDDDDVC